MSNDALFTTQLISVMVFIIALFVLYRMLVRNKDATIEFLQAQIAEARQPISDVVLRAQKERIQAAEAELERVLGDRDLLQKIGGTSDKLIQAHVKLGVEQNELISILEQKMVLVEELLRRSRKALDECLAQSSLPA